MPVFDQRLVRPSVVQLLECLGEASENAHLDRDIETWREHLEGIRAQAEGVQEWGSSCYRLLFAWWTDAGQRRHFRVQSIPGDGKATDELTWGRDHRFPLWFIYPSRVVLRERGGKHLWVAMCDCGRVDRIEALDWMGDRCGKCHESPGREVQWRLGTDVYLHRPDLHAERVAFSHDGRLVAIAGKDSFVDVWDCAERSFVRRLCVGPGAIRALAFLTDPEPWVAVGCEDRLLRFLRVDTGEEGGTIPTPSPLRQVEFIRGGTLLLMIAENSAEFWGRAGLSGAWALIEEVPDKFPPLIVSEVSGAGKWVKREDVAASMRRVAASRYGHWVALAGESTVRLWRCGEGRPVLHWMYRDEEHSISNVAFDRDKPTLFGLWREPYQARLRGGSFRVNSWSPDQSIPRHSWSGTYKANSPILTPGDRWIVTRDEHAICLHLAELSFDPVRLEDHPSRRLRSVWSSPDGETLASIDDLGRVRLWPWRHLV